MVNRISENGQDILERAKSTAKSVQSAHLAGLEVRRIGPFGPSTTEIQDLMPKRPLCGPALRRSSVPALRPPRARLIQDLKSFWCRREELTVRRSGLRGPDNTDLKILVPKRGLEPPRAIAHYPLKVACLPISPLRHKKLLILRNN